MKKTIILLIACCLLPAISFAQVTQHWVRTYNGFGNGGDNIVAMAKDGSGNIYVTGSSAGSGGYYDYCTIKYSSSGTQLWVERYDGPGISNDISKSIALDTNGNVFVTGSSSGIGTNTDYCTIKYNTDGIQQWVARYDGPGNYVDEAKSIAVDDSGSVYVTGRIAISPIDDDWCTIKYNSDGVQQWLVRYSSAPGYRFEEPRKIIVDASGNVFVSGFNTSSSHSNFCTVKYNSSGVQLWVSTYDGPANYYDEICDMALDDSGNVYVTGRSQGIGTDYDYCTVKYNSNGLQLWVKRYDGGGNYWDEPYAMAIDNMGNVYITGKSCGGPTIFSADFTTIKYDSEGTQMWVAKYDGYGTDTTYDAAYAIAVDASENVYVTGDSRSNLNASRVGTIKYDSSGIEQWVIIYTRANISDATYAIAIDDSDNVYVAGGSVLTGTNIDFLTIKYSQTTAGVNEIKTNNSFVIYPNPSNGICNIESEGLSEVKIFNSQGALVLIKTINGKDVLDLKGQSPGVYLIKIRNIEGILTQKITIIK